MLAVRHAAIVFPPRALLGVAEEVVAADMVAMADLGPAQPAKELLCRVDACALAAVRLLMVDATHLEAGMQGIPGARVVGIQDRALGDASGDEGQGSGFVWEHGGDAVAAALADDHDGAALAGLVAGEATIDAL